MHKDFSGVILAGGKSSRMGFPKPFISANGRRIIDITLETLRPFFKEIFIVTNDRKLFIEFKDIKLVEDLVKECGPLAGIYTGLKSISNPKAFFVACDMPFLHNELIERLINISKDSPADCIIPCSDRGVEPLCAIYSKPIIPKLEKALEQRDLSLVNTLNNINCEYVMTTQEEAKSFVNINTPQDLQELLRK